MKKQKEIIPPITQYTKCGEINIAYQVFGSGPIDLVYIPGWVSNIDWMWTCPELVEFFQELGKMARVILFDKRGTGLSDRVVELSTLEERMEDITTVMDAVGSEKAVLFGHSEGGSVSALFSATYPNRVISLITFGIFAQRKQSKGYPWAPSDQERQQVYNMIENNWCSGKMNLEALAPSKAKDQKFMNWLTSYFRYGASPRAALKLTKMNTEVNIVDILKYIKVPTLIMQRTNDIDVKIEEGKFIAERIKKSKFVEFKGADHLFWAGNQKEILEEMKSFINKSQPCETPKKRLVALLSGQFLSTIKNSLSKDKIQEIAIKQNGTLIHQSDKCFVLAFDVPGKAVKAAVALKEIFRNHNETTRMVVCMRENVKKEEVCLNEEDSNYLKSILGKVATNEIIVTQGIKHLLSGINLDFIPEASIFDTDTQGICKLYRVKKKLKTQVVTKKLEPVPIATDVFLEKVFQIIHQHLEDDTFGIEILSRKIGMSERQLQRKIKEVTKKSPTQLITSIRLKKAKEMLLSNDYNVAEVAFQFGFSSPSYFTRCFKKEFGVRPTTLQNQQKNDTLNLQFAMS